MIFSKTKAKSVLGFFIGAGLLVSCSEHKAPQAVGGNRATFIIEKVEGPDEGIAVGEPNNQGKYSQKLFPLQACVTDHAKSNSVSNLRFDIVAGDVTVSKISDHRGCLQWQELLDFDPDDESKNVMMTRTIVARESHSGSVKVAFNVNPISGKFKDLTLNGAYSDTATVANPVSFKIQEFVSNNPQTKQAQNEQIIYVKIENRLGNKRFSRIARQTEIETLNLESKGVDFYNLKIDQNLNLIFPFRYYTRFSISLVKQNLDGIKGQAIQRGNFRFHLAVLKENANLKDPSASDILAAVEFDGSPRGDAGLITVPIEFNFSNVTSISNRVNFLFTVVSTDSPARFEDQLFEGFANKVEANVDLPIKLYPSDASASHAYQVHSKAKAGAEPAKLSISATLKETGLIAIANPLVKYTHAINEAPNLAQVTKIVDLKSVIEKLDERKTLTLDEKRGVCSAYYQGQIKSLDDLSYQTCLKDPTKHIEASVSEFAESVDPEVSSDPMVLEVEKFNMTSEFKVGKKIDFSNGNSADATVDGKAGIKVAPFDEKNPLKGGFLGAIVAKVLSWTIGVTPVLEVNATVGGKAYIAREAKETESESTEGKITRERTLTSIPIVITMKAKTTKCMVILPRSLSSTGFSRYYCTPAQDETRTEHYYLVDYVRVEKTNVVIDSASGVVNPFHMLVRGTETFKSLRETLTSKAKITTFLISRIDPKKLDNPAHYMTQEAPRVFSSHKNIMSK